MLPLPGFTSRRFMAATDPYIRPVLLNKDCKSWNKISADLRTRDFPPKSVVSMYGLGKAEFLSPTMKRAEFIIFFKFGFCQFTPLSQMASFLL